ncbi:unnamed protein product [Hydatigera taeniaeformis]|uniref:GPS domain-containing protein n=1 Tax=Hydatigena taeniaeformis TaxID=6205 RepID=A0A0R3XBK1_HYDTA|nr:unnamed protein product [Hydatigera taeniaeformis]
MKDCLLGLCLTHLFKAKGTSLEEVERNHTFFVSNVDFHRAKVSALELARGVKMTKKDANTFFVGYRQLNEEEVDRYSTENPPPRPYPHESQINVTARVRAFVSSCNHLEANSKVWSTSGCKVMRETTASVVVCECNHLTAFAGGFNALATVVSHRPSQLRGGQPQARLINGTASASPFVLVNFLLLLQRGLLRAFRMSALSVLVTALLIPIP